MLRALIILFVGHILLAYAIAYDTTFFGIVGALLILPGSIRLSRKIADYFVELGSGSTYIEENRHSNLSRTEKKHDWINGISLFLCYVVFVILQFSFFRFEQRQIERSGINSNATVTQVFYKTHKKDSVRVIEYTYTVNGKQYTHQCNNRNEALNDTVPIRLLPDFPDLHYIRNYRLRKQPIHQGRSIDYNSLCYPYTPPAIVLYKITRAPWAISYHEYGPFDIGITPKLIVIYPDGDRLKKVTMYNPEFGVPVVPSEMAETVLTGYTEKLAIALSCKLRSGNFPTEENPKSKLNRRRFYDSSHFNFRIYNRGLTRDLFYTNAVHYLAAPAKEQAEAAITLMRQLRDH